MVYFTAQSLGSVQSNIKLRFEKWTATVSTRIIKIFVLFTNKV